MEHGRALCNEYRYRYGKQHACAAVIDEVSEPPPGMQSLGFDEPPQAMPPEFQVPGDAVLGYRNYYLARKVGQSRWTRRDVPPFVQGEHIMATKKSAPKSTPAAEAPAPTPAAEAPAAEAPAAKTRGPRGVADSATIKLLVQGNPKREGSKAHGRFAAYVDGMTVGAALDAGVTTPDLVYDSKHGFISIEGYDPGEIVQPKPKAPKADKPAKGKKEKVEKTAEQTAAEQAADASAAEEAMD